jgi:hypothetical protein
LAQVTKDRVRLSPRVDRGIVRLAKSKAAAKELTLEWVVEQLLALWVAGKVNLTQAIANKSESEE